MPPASPSACRARSGRTLDFFNTAAFALPASGQLGTAGRNTITGPGMVNFNMSLGRFFTFSREKNLRARFSINATNIFNHPNYSERRHNHQRAEFWLGDGCRGDARGNPQFAV